MVQEPYQVPQDLEGHTMEPHASTDAPASTPPATPPRRAGSASILTLVNGVLAGIGAVYATTRSVTVTLIAGVIAVVLAGLVLILAR